MNCKVERNIEILEDRAIITDFKGNRDKHLPLVKFSYINFYNSHISIAPFEDLYGRRCNSPIGLFDVVESSLIVPKLIYKNFEKVYIIRNRLKTTYIG